MCDDIVIQTPELACRRMAEQLRRKTVDSGQYFGDEPTATAWTELTEHGQTPMQQAGRIPLDPVGDTDLTVVDLGPGSGKPCERVLGPIRDRVREIKLIDVSAAMLHLAKAHLR